MNARITPRIAPHTVAWLAALAAQGAQSGAEPSAFSPPAANGRAIAWGTAASMPGAAPAPKRLPLALQPLPTPVAATASAAAGVAPASGRAATTAAASPSWPDAAARAQAPLKVVRVSSARSVPLAGAALAAANAQVLAEAQALPARATAVPSARPLQKSQIAVLGAVDASLACVPGSTQVPRGPLTPGGRVSIRGCELGSRRGELRMLGQFPGGMVRLQVEEWTPQLVIASVPAALRGVVDQDVRLQLVSATGTAAKEQPGRFQAQRETVELPESLISNVGCASPQPSTCYITTQLGTHWAAGLHQGTDSQRGSDQWRLSLGPSWELERYEQKGTGARELQVLARSANQQLVAVHWESMRSDGSAYSAWYQLRFFVTGPAGVPFTAGLN